MQGRDIYADLEKIEQRGKRKKKKDKGFLSFGSKRDDEQERQPMREPEPKPEVAYQPEDPSVRSEARFQPRGRGPARQPPERTEPEIALVETAPEPEREDEEPVPVHATAHTPPETTETEPHHQANEGVVLKLEPEPPRQSQAAPSHYKPRERPHPSYAAPQPTPYRTREPEPVGRPGEEGARPSVGEGPETVTEISVVPGSRPTWQPLAGKELERANEQLTAYKRWLNQGFRAGLVSREQCQTMTEGKEIELKLKPPA